MDNTHLTLEITNNLGQAVLLINDQVIKPDEKIAFRLSQPQPVTIQRKGRTVTVTIPDATTAEHLAKEGICICITSNLTFTLTPTESMNITLQTGYASDVSKGVRCGDGF
jgi:hypothetical protein